MGAHQHALLTHGARQRQAVSPLDPKSPWVSRVSQPDMACWYSPALPYSSQIRRHPALFDVDERPLGMAQAFSDIGERVGGLHLCWVVIPQLLEFGFDLCDLAVPHVGGAQQPGRSTSAATLVLAPSPSCVAYA